jgi:hypothetical protein
MPLLLGARTRFFLPAVPFFRPSLTAGFGGAWVRFLPEGAAAVNSFVPLAFVTPAIHIFEPIEAGGDAVFQDFTFGLSYQHRRHSDARKVSVRPSMGSVGDCFGNAMCESFFTTLECELLAKNRFRSQVEARLAVFDFIEGWYIPHRRHSALDYRSPVNYERLMATGGFP